jgi:nickel/cobalt exporter
MPDLTQIIQSSASYAWLYLPVAALLGALHALEPGHAKSLMAAYIISIRGSAGQAALLGVSASVGHTIVVWLLAILGLLFGNALIVAEAEPWLTLLSGILIVLLAARILRQIWRNTEHGHDHSHPHPHHHHDHGDHHHPHHHHGHVDDPQQPYGRAKASDIIWFGFTGGLLPCPAAIAVLLVCIQLRQFALGVAMVLAFSVGLAATLVAIGIAASWGLRKVGSVRWLDHWAPRLPLVSASIVMAVGAIMTATGISGILSARK